MAPAWRAGGRMARKESGKKIAFANGLASYLLASLECAAMPMPGQR